MPSSDLSTWDPGQLSKASFLPAHLRDNPVNTAVMVQTLVALGLPVTHLTLAETYVVNGRPGLMAALQRALAWEQGWEVVPIEMAADRAVVRIRPRSGRDPGTVVSFTMEDARRANLAGKDTYKQWPDRMLFARATTKAINFCCPQVLFSMGEAGTVDAEEWEQVSAAPPDPVPPPETGEEIPTEIYDNAPEAYEDPTGEKYDPDDVNQQLGLGTYDPSDPERPFE